MFKKNTENFILVGDNCQRTQLPGLGHGYLPPSEALVASLFELTVNYIGQWQINIGQQVLHF
jgi:hypothetical protein